MEKTDKKRKWERDYENYANSTELNERIEALTELTNGKVAFKEEYKELKQLTAIKANLPKVKNILELREKLEGQRLEIKAYIDRQESISKIDKTLLSLEAEMTELETAQTVLEEKLKSPNLSEEEKAKIQKEIEENKAKKQANNVKFGDCHEELEKYNKQGKSQEQFKDMAIDDVKNQYTQISMNISKCNLACNKLMSGYSWQSVEVAIDKYETERLTAKGVQAEKMKQNRAAAKGQPIKAEPVKVEPAIEKVETALEVPTRWQKIRGWAKNLWEKWFVKEVDESEVKDDEKQEKSTEKKSLWSKIKDFYNKFMEKEEPTKIEEVKPETEKEKEEPATTETKQDAFRQYLRDVAQKGIDQVEQDKNNAENADKEAKRQAAIRKLIDNKRNARGDDGGTIAKLEEKLKAMQDDNGREL